MEKKRGGVPSLCYLQRSLELKTGSSEGKTLHAAACTPETANSRKPTNGYFPHSSDDEQSTH